MTANVHPETGIPYGVASANGFQELASDIMTDGKDLTLADWEDDVRTKILGILEDFEGSDITVAADEIASHVAMEFWTATFKAQLDLSEREAAKVAGVLMDLWDGESRTFDIAEVQDAVYTHLQENDYFCNDGMDGHEYEYSSGAIQYRMGTLGGAYLIWVCKSPYVTYAKTCSPCVPNAGDLDSCTDENRGSLCYCFDPDDWCIEENKEIWPEVIYFVNDDGTPGAVAWKNEASDG